MAVFVVFETELAHVWGFFLRGTPQAFVDHLRLRLSPRPREPEPWRRASSCNEGQRGFPIHCKEDIHHDGCGYPRGHASPSRGGGPQAGKYGVSFASQGGFRGVCSRRGGRGCLRVHESLSRDDGPQAGKVG